MNREFISENLSIDHKAHYSFYLKTGSEGTYIRRPKAEHAGYKMLSPYLRTPRVKLADTINGTVLVVLGIEAPSASLALLSNPESAVASLNAFLLDIIEMWQETARPMEVEKLSRNWRTETINTLLRLMNDPIIRAIDYFPVVVNGNSYPCLKSTMSECLRKLTTAKEPTMVLCHGDEHLGNLLSGPDGYWAIDPGNYTGYNTPSSTVNNLVGGTYLFEYRYSGEAKVKQGVFSVEYALLDEFLYPELLMRPLFIKFEDSVKNMLGNNSLSKELLFTNELRVALGWSHRRMDLTEIKKTSLVYAGLATEHYYADYIV